VHLQFLGQSSLRISAFLQCVWTILTGHVSSRLIVNHHASANNGAPQSVGSGTPTREHAVAD